MEMNKSFSLLPAQLSHADYAVLRTDAALWPRVMRIICQRHGLPSTDLRRFGDGTDPADGTCIAFAVGERLVIKLFPPFHRRLFEAERATAEHVYEKLSIVTPAIMAYGTFDACPYLIMSRLQGTYLSDIWDSLEHTNQLSLLIELAGVLAQLHALPAHTLTHLDSDWEDWMARRVDGCAQRHREQEVPENWLAQMPGFLARTMPLYPARFTPALISGDIHQYHLLARREDSRWRLAGLFDFDDAFVGFHEYDLAAAGLFFMAGRSALLRPFLLAYGYTQDDLNERLSQRLLAYTLLHRYRPFNWVRTDFVQHPCSTLEELATAIYPVE